MTHFTHQSDVDVYFNKYTGKAMRAEAFWVLPEPNLSAGEATAAES